MPGQASPSSIHEKLNLQRLESKENQASGPREDTTARTSQSVYQSEQSDAGTDEAPFATEDHTAHCTGFEKRVAVEGGILTVAPEVIGHVEGGLVRDGDQKSEHRIIFLAAEVGNPEETVLEK